MVGLAETTARLANLKRGRATTTGAPGPARMRPAAFSPNPGGLRMLSYSPEDLAPHSPLVVVLHGCTQSAEAYAEAGGWLTLADRYGFAVLAPEQSASNNPNRCFNWFEPGDTGRGRGEAASIAAMVGATVAAHDIDPARVFITGLSAGGAMTAAMLATYPDLFAAGGIIAGLPFGAAGNLREALSSMHGGSHHSASELAAAISDAGRAGAKPPRVAIWHGGADHTVSPANAEQAALQWAAAHGLSRPSAVKHMPGWTRTVWRAADSEHPLVEMNMIVSLGHGTPLATGGPDGVGTVSPFMLEAGVSSSLELLRFWGLAGPEVRTAAEVAQENARPAAHTARASEPPSVGDHVMASIAGHVPGPVGDTIAGALRAAGLLK